MSEKRILLLTNAKVRGVLRSPAEGGGNGILAPIGEANQLIADGMAKDLSEKRPTARSRQAKPNKAAPPSKPGSGAASVKSPPATPAPPPPPPPAAE